MYFFFFNDTATTEIYTLSLHDALPISRRELRELKAVAAVSAADVTRARAKSAFEYRSQACLLGLPLLHIRRPTRSEEHTSELQSRQYLVCRLLLEKKKIKYITSWILPS